MQITINNEPREFAESLSIAELLERLALTGQRVAVEVDREIVPRGRHGETLLRGGECVEIVHAIGGG